MPEGISAADHAEGLASTLANLAHFVGHPSAEPAEPEGRLYHGTRAQLAPGDLVTPGHAPNFGRRTAANFVHLAGTMDAAVWGAELAGGDGAPHVYAVEPTGVIEDDPNLTDIRYPGNPTRSYQSHRPVRVVEECTGWEPHLPAVVDAMRATLRRLAEQGVEAIDD